MNVVSSIFSLYGLAYSGVNDLITYLIAALANC